MRDLPRWKPEDEEANVDLDWIELDLSPLDPRDGTFRSRSFAIRVKSSSNDSEWLIHDPVDFLVQTLGKQFPELGIEAGKTRVTTLIVNHHNTLSRIHLSATASTTDDGTIGLTLTKVPPTS